MSQEQNTGNKKKLLTYYLILGACILLIAAVTVTVIFAVRSDNPLDINQGADDVTDGGGDDEDDEDDEQPDEDVSSAYEFVAPVAEMNVINDYTFYYNKTLDCYHYHTGIDLAAEAGTNVVACADGTVESVSEDVLTGTQIVVDHGDGLKSVYCFVTAADGLEAGDTVSKGEAIATIAEANGSEYKDGPHLHLEVTLNGANVDPTEYLTLEEK